MSLSKICNRCKTDKPATSVFFPKDSRKKSGIQGPCKECVRLDWRNRYKNDPLFRQKHIDHVLRGQKENPEARNRRRNEWDKRHPHKANAKWATRHAAKLRQTPEWLTYEQKKEIELIYAHAHAATRALGILYTVDHILPLQGKTVSGLHVPWNLQVITGSENYKKHNKVIYVCTK